VHDVFRSTIAIPSWLLQTLPRVKLIGTKEEAPSMHFSLWLDLFYKSIVRIHLTIFVVAIKRHYFFVDCFLILPSGVSINAFMSHHWYLNYICSGWVEGQYIHLRRTHQFPIKCCHKPIIDLYICIFASQASDIPGFYLCCSCLCSSKYGETIVDCWRTAECACLNATRLSTSIESSPVVSLPCSLPSQGDTNIICKELCGLIHCPSFN
jgi:hypothetical protein